MDALLKKSFLHFTLLSVALLSSNLSGLAAPKKSNHITPVVAQIPTQESDGQPHSEVEAALEILAPGTSGAVLIEQQDNDDGSDVTNPDAEDDLFEPFEVESPDEPLFRPLTVLGNNSCSAIPGATPVTKPDIINRARARGFATDVNTIGRLFENFVLDSLARAKNTTRFPSPARAARTGGRLTQVEPDAVTPVVVVIRDPNGTVRTVTYNQSTFFDAKAIREGGTISLSSGTYQTLGYIDVLSRSPAGTSTGSNSTAAVLVYVTTDDVTVSQQVLTEATRNRVAVWQQIACNNRGGTAGRNDLVVGQGLLLNPAVYAGKVQLLRVQAGTPATLRP